MCNLEENMAWRSFPGPCQNGSRDAVPPTVSVFDQLLDAGERMLAETHGTEARAIVKRAEGERECARARD